MPIRSLNRRAVVLALVGGVVAQAVYGTLRSLSLLQDRPYALGAWNADPLRDIWINAGITLASAVVIVLLLAGAGRLVWWFAVAVLVAGLLDAVAVTAAPYGGPAYAGLAALRLAVLCLFTTPLVRALYGVGT